MSLLSTNGSYPQYPFNGLRQLIRWLVDYWKQRTRPPSGSGQNGGYTDQW